MNELILDRLKFYVTYLKWKHVALIHVFFCASKGLNKVFWALRGYHLGACNKIRRQVVEKEKKNIVQGMCV